MERSATQPIANIDEFISQFKKHLYEIIHSYSPSNSDPPELMPTRWRRRNNARVSCQIDPHNMDPLDSLPNRECGGRGQVGLPSEEGKDAHCQSD
jgi:hypothetical protein